MTVAPFICDFDGSYASGKYRLIPETVGFGINVCTILHDGEFLHRIAHHNALNLAQAWVLDHEAVELHENGDGC